MKLKSQALTSSETFRANRAAHLEALEVVHQAAEAAAEGGGAASRERHVGRGKICLLYTSPSPRDQRGSRMPSSA